MMRTMEDPKPGIGIEIAKAVTIATLSAAATGLVNRGIEAMKARVGRRTEWAEEPARR